jgi:uncharacterized protein GlcG (DUF336 family)
VLAFPAFAHAQAPLVEKNISMKMALMIIEGATEQCSKDGYRVAVVIVDRACNVVASLRGDGTKPHMMEFARRKAFTAVTNPPGTSSLEFRKLAEQRPHLKQIPDIVLVGGGMPIKAGGEIIGAVGVSGAPGEEMNTAPMPALRGSVIPSGNSV